MATTEGMMRAAVTHAVKRLGITRQEAWLLVLEQARTTSLPRLAFNHTPVYSGKKQARSARLSAAALKAQRRCTKCRTKLTQDEAFVSCKSCRTKHNTIALRSYYKRMGRVLQSGENDG